MGALDGFNVGYGRRVAPRKTSPKERELIGYLVVRIRKDGMYIVCRTKGDYSVSPVVVYFNEASLFCEDLKAANPLEQYRIVEVYLP